MAGKEAVALQRVLEELSRQVRSGLRDDLFTKCRFCKKFVLILFCATEGCSVCDWHVSICNQCIKDHRTEKSLMSHWRYYANQGVRMDRKAHYNVWKEYKHPPMSFKDLPANVIRLSSHKKFKRA